MSPSSVAYLLRQAPKSWKRLRLPVPDQEPRLLHRTASVLDRALVHERWPHVVFVLLTILADTLWPWSPNQTYVTIPELGSQLLFWAFLSILSLRESNFQGL
ncbi:hypothetical protein D9M71_734100 [compost metagenome]